MNVCNFIGRIGRDAETRYTQGGRAVAGWALAVDTGYGEGKTTTWIDCSLWGDRAEKLAEYIRKGDRIGVTGEIGTREHNGKTYITLNVRDVTLLGVKSDQRNEAKPAAQKRNEAPKPAGDSFDDDDLDSIPF